MREFSWKKTVIDWPNFAEHCLSVADIEEYLHRKPPVMWVLKAELVRGAGHEFRELENGGSCMYFANIYWTKQATHSSNSASESHFSFGKNNQTCFLVISYI